jgi:UDP-N-acetylmuramoyl-tripeptide--D-alanyl-D-alanine ligase
MTGVTVSEAAEMAGGELHGQGGAAVTGAVIDSREVFPGCLFAAMPGAKADGHEFISAAFDMGAACCLALRVPEGETRPVIVVGDVAAALTRLAAAYRQRLSIPIIGVAGSVGKTTAKEMTALVLSKRFSVLKTEKNFNNELGVPMTLCRIDGSHQAAVVEMGISDFGEMARLGRLVRPTMAIYTIIGHSHLEKLHDRAGVFRAKTEMLDFLPEDGTVFANGDDDMLAAMECRQKKVLFGLGENNDVRAVDVETDAESSSCVIVRGARRISVRIPAYGRHMVYAALAGAAAGMELGLSDGEIAAGIADYKPVGRRAVIEDTGFVTLIDDCYNANPDSVRCAVDSMAEISGRRVCVLGDMLELGEDTEKLHLEVGGYAARHGAELVLTAGELGEFISRGAESAGCAARHFADTDALIAALPELLRRGDAVLVKASHGMRFERVSEAVKELKN